MMWFASKIFGHDISGGNPENFVKYGNLSLVQSHRLPKTQRQQYGC